PRPLLGAVLRLSWSFLLLRGIFRCLLLFIFCHFQLLAFSSWPLAPSFLVSRKPSLHIRPRLSATSLRANGEELTAIYPAWFRTSCIRALSGRRALRVRCAPGRSLGTPVARWKARSGSPVRRYRL